MTPQVKWHAPPMTRAVRRSQVGGMTRSPSFGEDGSVGREGRVSDRFGCEGRLVEGKRGLAPCCGGGCAVTMGW